MAEEDEGNDAMEEEGEGNDAMAEEDAKTEAAEYCCPQAKGIKQIVRIHSPVTLFFISSPYSNRLSAHLTNQRKFCYNFKMSFPV